MREVFVEGAEDRSFFLAFLKTFGLGDVAVFSIDTIEVPANEVLSRQLNDGNKGRVVTLAAMLEGKIPQSEFACIADADTDHFEKRIYNYSLLLLTDYPSLEVYLLSPRSLDKIVIMMKSKISVGSGEIIRDLSNLLVDSFLIRVAAAQLRLSLDFPVDHSKFCSLKKNKMAFRTDDYLSSCLRSSPEKESLRQLKTRVEELRNQKIEEPRHMMHGHDMVSTFIWYLRQHGAASLNPKTMEDLMLLIIDFNAVAEEQLFKSLLSRFEGRSVD